MITLSCGCEYKETMGDLDSLYVHYRTEVCDPVEGFVNAVNSGVYCPACIEIIAVHIIDSDEEEQKWLS